MMENRLCVHRDQKPIYDIIIEESFEKLSGELRKLKTEGRKVCIVTETKVASFYLSEVTDIAEKEAAFVTSYVFPEGEASKNLMTVNGLYDHLIRNRFDRKDLLIALGGGVTGDLTGFAAATYLRGIDFIQIPTTLLSQVDSSIGGKTGVDYKEYKNMIGAFHMPELVYINTGTLRTLSERDFCGGMGEIIKHGLIRDRTYLQFIHEHKEEILRRDQKILKKLIHGSCEIKKAVVEKDPEEKGERALLNFGHTLGHAIEKQMDFSLLHGECVMLGMIAALFISRKRDRIGEREYRECVNLFHWFKIPELPIDLDLQKVIGITKMDKKMEQGTIKFIILSEIGKAEIVRDISDSMMMDAMKETIKESRVTI